MVIWRNLTQWVQRLFVVPQLLVASLSGPVSPEYSVDNSMSTLARFPWIYTCVHAIATDQAGRPLVAYRPAKRGAKRVEVHDPALDLLEAPNATTTAFLFRKQLWVDFLLPGNAYIWRPEGPASVAVYRLHPRAVRPIPGPMGMVAGYEWQDTLTSTTRILPPDQVVHIRDVSWRDDVQSLLGESVIRCLHDDLTAELGGRLQAAQAASRGRPDILFSVKTQLGPDGADKLLDRWEKGMKARNGAFVVGGEVTATPLSWSPEEAGQPERSAQIRDTTLAVFGVPPARAGIPVANYAIARQQIKDYWEGLKGRVRIFDDAFSMLAAPGVRIGHDYSTVEALQVSYTERLLRVQTWVALGWTPEDAAAYEGFQGLPPRPKDADKPKEQPKPAVGEHEDDEPAEPADKALAGKVAAAVWLHLRCAEAAYADITSDVDTTLFVRWQTERLFLALTEAGLHAEAARWWAEELCGVTDEHVRMGSSVAFTEERARRTAELITQSLRRAA